VCAPYAKPCVLDVKLGPRTWYAWAEPAYVEKCRAKDGATSQAASGFRLCGARAYRPAAAGAAAAAGEWWTADRHWGKGLRSDDGGIARALRRFAANGTLGAADVFRPALAQLRRLLAAAEAQRSFALFSASALLLYEGEAACGEAAGVRVALVDFAHAFPGEDDGGNLAAGLRAFIATLEALLVEEEESAAAAGPGSGGGGLTS